MNTNDSRQRLNALAARMGLASFTRSRPSGASTFSDLPPFHTALAALNMRRRSWKILFFASTALCAGVIAFQQRIIMHKLFEKGNESVVIVPGAPEFSRVRPGQIPDESVYIFGEFVAANLGNFTWRNVRYHFGKVAQYMTPAMRGRFERDLEARSTDWIERRVDQTFAYEPVRAFALTNDATGPIYRLTIEGTRSQYVEGRSFSEGREFLKLAFRVRGNLTADKPFVFELDSVEWLTTAQYAADKQSENTVSNRESDTK